VDRRTFLQRSGGLAALLAGAQLVGGDPLEGGVAGAAARLVPADFPVGTPILVLIDLAGGNDATNLVIDPNDPWYYDQRQGHGAIAIAADQLLPLKGTTKALNPAFAWLAKRYATAGDVAFVLGSGENVAHEFSHFAAQHYRQAASFSPSVTTGWLGRFNDLMAPRSPFASVSTSGVHPALLAAQTPVLSVPSVQNFDFTIGWEWQDDFRAALQQMAVPSWAKGSGGLAAQQNLASTLTAQVAVAGAWNETVANTFDSTDIAQQLSTAALLIAAGIPSRTYVVTYGSFDTHAGEDAAEDTLFGNLDAALGQFFAAIEATPRAADVVVLCTSEFGRQQTANDSAGTDHGQAGLDLLVGKKVRGGLYGLPPKTAPADRLDDALVPTVDFRSTYATVLNHLTGSTAVAQELLFGTFEDLGCFR